MIKTTYEIVDPALLQFARYQRPVDVARVKEYAKDFDRAAIGTIVVSRREDGTLWCIDGRHRHALLGAKGLTAPLMCEVRTGMTYEGESEAFHTLNKNRKPVNAAALFNSQVEAKDVFALGILETLERLGLRWTSSVGRRCVTAVAALVRAEGNGNLETSLRALLAWAPEDPRTFDGRLLSAFSAFFKRFPDASHARLGLVLSRDISPAAMITKIRIAAKESDASRLRAATSVLREFYNYKLTHGRLEGTV